MNQSKGFTIIELIVVIAIIAVLTSIVIVNVSGYITKARQAQVKAILSELQKQGTIYSEQHGNYNGFCDLFNSPGGKFSVPEYFTGDYEIGGGRCYCDAYTGFGGGNECPAGSTAWCACSYMFLNSSPSPVYCVDSTGFSGLIDVDDCETACGFNTGTGYGHCENN
jgi:prepilin-type N-terminal cleavage/methylation domain-containing protein